MCNDNTEWIKIKKILFAPPRQCRLFSVGNTKLWIGYSDDGGCYIVRVFGGREVAVAVWQTCSGRLVGALLRRPGVGCEYKRRWRSVLFRSDNTRNDMPSVCTRRRNGEPLRGTTVEGALTYNTCPAR